MPEQAATYMHLRIGKRNPIYIEESWVIVRNYQEFTKEITERGLPEFVSFDHDLADVHYHDCKEYFEYQEETGLDCAEWLVKYCREKDLELPECAVHSMNPVGTEKIIRTLEEF